MYKKIKNECLIFKVQSSSSLQALPSTYKINNFSKETSPLSKKYEIDRGELRILFCSATDPLRHIEAPLRHNRGIIASQPGFESECSILQYFVIRVFE